MKHTNIIFIGTMIALAAIAFSCNTNKPIPDDLTAKELIQRGQEAFEKGRTKQSLSYFNAVVDRFGSEPALYVEARYEIGHLYMRNKDYEHAVPVLEELTALYANSPVGTFPAAYDKLAKLELEKVPKEKRDAIREKVQAEKEAAARELEAAAQKDLLEQELSAQKASEATPAEQAESTDQTDAKEPAEGKEQAE